MIYITDYIEESTIEKKILGKNLINTPSNKSKKDIEVLLVWHKVIDEDYLKEYPKIKAIVRYGVGFDNVDTELCNKKGIKVFNNPDYGVDEVSDTSLGIIMNLSRCISSYDKKSKILTKFLNVKKPWQENTNKNALRLKDCRLGLIGVGRIGSSLALKMKNIVGGIEFYDPYVPSGYEKVLSAKRHKKLESLLKSVDIVSIHAPLSKETIGLVDDKFIGSMKRGSMLVNTARGGLISSTDCLFRGIKSGRLSAIGLDVLPEEPPVNYKNDKFISLWMDQKNDLSEKIIINPHTSYYSPQSYKEMREKAARIALNALRGNQILNRIV